MKKGATPGVVRRGSKKGREKSYGVTKEKYRFKYERQLKVVRYCFLYN